MLTTKNWRAQLAWLGSGLILVANLTGCTPAGPRALLDGERLIRAGKYSQAIEKLQVATQLLPSNAQAWNHLGLAYHKAAQPNNALKAYEQARRCDLNLTPVRYNLGCLLLEQNNLQPAIAELTAYTLLQEDSVDGWLKLATAQLRARQWDAAERNYRKALQLKDELPAAWNSLGVIQMERKRPKDALHSFSLALQKQPGYAPALLNSAIVYEHHVNNPSLALQKYQEYLQLKPVPSEAGLVQEIVRRLGTELSSAAQRQQREMAAAARHTSEPLVTQPVHHAVTDRAGGDVANRPPATSRRQDIAIEVVKAVAPPVKAQSAPEPEKTEPLTAPEQPFETLLADAVRTSTVSEPPPVEIAATERPREVAAPPQSQPIRPNAAENATEAQPPAKTDIVQLEEEPPLRLPEDRPPAQAPQPLPVHVSQPRQLPAQVDSPRQQSDADPLVRMELPREKPSVIDRLNPTTWFRNRRRPQPDSVPVDALPEKRAESGSNRLYALARSPARNAPEQQASVYAQRYSYRSPAKPAPGDRFKAQSFFAQAVQAHRDGRLGEAISNYDQATTHDPAFFEAHYNLGLAAYESKNWPLSLSAYETALSINSTSANCRYNFALALQQAGYYQDAADQLEQLVIQHPSEARAHLTLASLYAEELAKPLLARPHYRKVLELAPQHGQAPAIRYWLTANP